MDIVNIGKDIYNPAPPAIHTGLSRATPAATTTDDNRLSLIDKTESTTNQA